MRESIRGFADAVLERAAEENRVGPVAGELASFAEVLGASEDLRRVLSDPGVAAHMRRAVVTDLLGDRASAEVYRLVAFVVDADRATEFVDDVNWLVARARHAQAGGTGFEGPLGRSAAAERIDGYAAGVLDEVERAVLGEVEDELFRFVRVVEASEELTAALTDRSVPFERREALVRDLLSGRTRPATVRLAGYAARVGRPRDFVETLDRLVARVAAENDRRVAEVRAAVEMDDNQRRRLADALGRITGRPVDVRVTVDPVVLGGFVATVGDTVVDGSARYRLDLLKERLILPEANVTTTGESS